MLLFKNALLAATYNEGKPGKKLTPMHEKAEHHRFKKEFLFKEPVIAKEYYLSRLIQHYLLIRAIENQLRSLSADQKTELNPFFTLNYLDQLWRTAGIEDDLRYLGMDVESIKIEQIAPTTTSYLNLLPTLNAKNLLAHFLFHLAGFMHGGGFIKLRIEKSNEIADFQIPSQQYDFSKAQEKVNNPHCFELFNLMMKQVNRIELSDQEYQDIIDQGNKVYELMSLIYDDLCLMHTNKDQSLCASLSVIGLGVSLMGFVFAAAANLVSTAEVRPC